ncbi:hypothetical protein B4168_0851 [Anoxybacillus flavithermus]|nr:hypothetical protein B4168_0851 [Anoxybacillus flavithermus]OAO86858.1 hypothetical protein GT23_1876 [Parageobacillus thermoglucosidasius]
MSSNCRRYGRYSIRAIAAGKCVFLPAMGRRVEPRSKLVPLWREEFFYFLT